MERLFDAPDEPPEDARVAAPPATGPLAARMRPRTLAEFVGQEHLLGEGSALRTALESGHPHSMVLYGPPGTGKTTLARLAAEHAEAAFEELSAVNAGRAEVRAVIARADERRRGPHGRPTIFFLDEIHRFNKAQQDALLPAVEEGLVTLIGATTENPYFEVNSALLSRTQIYTLEPHSVDDLVQVVERGARELDADVPDAVARRPQHPRARVADGQGRGERDRRASRGTGIDEAAAPLRQGRRPALRLHLGVHQVDARLGSGRRGLLPRSDARGRRRSALHRPAHDRAGVRGHRQRRPARAARRRRGRACGRARRPARGAAQPVTGGRVSGACAEIERVLRGSEGGDPRRPRAGQPPSAEGASGHALSWRAQVRSRRGLRLSPRGSARIRSRLPAGRAQGNEVLPAEWVRRGGRGHVRRRLDAHGGTWAVTSCVTWGHMGRHTVGTPSASLRLSRVRGATAAPPSRRTPRRIAPSRRPRARCRTRCAGTRTLPRRCARPRPRGGRRRAATRRFPG